MTNYTWKIGIQPTSSRELSTNKPVRENEILADLYTGEKYLVQKVYKARPQDKAWPIMPDTALQTWPIGKLSEGELDALRRQAGYLPDAFCLPLGDMVVV